MSLDFFIENLKPGRYPANMGDVVTRMKTIIAGGRDCTLTKDDIMWLNTLPISEVVSGGALGADIGGEQWARTKGIPVKRFPADWATYGKAAGPIRNARMVEYADAVVLFPGGRGTDNMRSEAKKAGLTFFNKQQ